ncbi:MAG: gamma-glutamylcyclotransferase [Candidatus Competibacteraceae bacterium]|nr:gamma-glutamylcyclotransferase [Candidatus Competibacteraceae bacterium]
MSNIFVYGTLLKGMARSNVLNACHYLGPGLIGARLYDLGQYPGIKDGDGFVVGEAYEINQQTLNRLDEIEGYHPKHHRESLFIRKTYEVCLMNGEQVDCYVYSYNDRVNPRDWILHGDYRRHLLERTAHEQWLIAYGSNMSSVRIAERVGEVKECRKGYLNGYQLAFNKKAYQHDSARANIRYDGKSRCPAVAWKLSYEQLEMLDMFEGVPHQYVRAALPLMTNTGALLAQGYIAHPDVLISELNVENTYMEHIRKGYEEHGFDVDMIRQ